MAERRDPRGSARVLTMPLSAPLARPAARSLAQVSCHVSCQGLVSRVSCRGSRVGGLLPGLGSRIGLASGSPPPRPSAKGSGACSRSGQGRSPSRGIACLFQPCLERAGHDDLAEAKRGRIGAPALDQAIDAGAIVLAAHKRVGQPMVAMPRRSARTRHWATLVASSCSTRWCCKRRRPKASAASGSRRTTSCKVAMLPPLGTP
jgi:hypothetical protein